MFDASDQFQQFIASSTPTSSSFPLHFSSCLHDNASSFPNSFEPNNHFHQHQELSTFHAHAQAQAQAQGHAHAHARGSSTNFDLDLEMIRSERGSTDHPWSADELLALLRIRSTFDNWFPQFTWEHVSRKLAELGFKRSPEECKERFEEESRDLNHMSSTINYRSFQSGLEQLYHGEGESEAPAQKKPRDDDDDDDKIGQNLTTETDPHDDGDGNVDPHEHEHEQEHDVADEKKVKEESKSKMKRKREERLGILKGFCEDLVRRMVAQQEEMHQKLLQDMVKRDEEMVCREEAWKRQEMDKMNKELEIRAQEQSIAGLRQASIIHFLNKYTPPHQPNPSNNKPNHNSPLTSPQNPNSSTQELQTSDSHADKDDRTCLSTRHAEESGKRWPRDQVVALINLRASLYSNNGNAQGWEGGREGKAPLWERISQGMKEMGYKRSAKRCKEKWENINKYFRKTKNANKNRSLDSRTCPYFHHLTALYSKGTFPGTPENHSPLPENHSSLPDSSPKDHTGGTDTERGEEHMVEEVADMGFI